MDEWEPDCDPDTVLLLHGEGDIVSDADADGEPLTAPDTVFVTDAVVHGEVEGDALAQPDTDIVPDGDLEPEPLLHADGDADSESDVDGERLAELVTVLVMDDDAHGE